MLLMIAWYWLGFGTDKVLLWTRAISSLVEYLEALYSTEQIKRVDIHPYISTDICF